jgi:hypothetical protein
LHVALDAERLFLHSARPPSALRLEGQRLTSVQTLVLNGRSFRRAGPRTELLVVSGADWAEAQIHGARPFDSPAQWLPDADEYGPNEMSGSPEAGRFASRRTSSSMEI